jgi:anaerobic selenocysteine-containing dehydrogenase
MSEHPDGYPLRMIGMREPRSENSWMHNAPLLMRGDRAHHALIHVDDAADMHISDGDLARVTSPYGEITVGVTTTKDLVPGVIAVPHGWGHKGTGTWRVANRAGGANVNRLSRASRPTSSRSPAWRGLPVCRCESNPSKRRKEPASTRFDHARLRWWRPRGWVTRRRRVSRAATVS